MGCLASTQDCRTRDIAARLRDAEQDGPDWEASCPSCGHGGFRVSKPSRSNYRHIWTCSCRRCRCSPATMRVALLRLGVLPSCLGDYGGYQQPSTDPGMAARIVSAAKDILDAPGLKPADMRIVLAEAMGQKVPDDFRTFAKWATGIGIGRSQAYEAAARWCRPAD